MSRDFVKSVLGTILVDTYRVERLIAEGGMGGVFEARHLRVPKRFAVKFLNLSLIDNAEAQARFRREAEIIASLEHPNIVNLLDYNVTAEGVPFIVLEFLDGEHLGKRIARGPMGLPETMRVLGAVSSALTIAHQHEIVHRDLKPENIVLVRDGEQIKVVDFGIAKIHGGADLTAANMILGTIAYMAPEQLFGTTLDARADQFALGAIAYEMLSGTMAFGGLQSVPEVAARVASYQPPYLSGLPAAVSEVILQAMAKKPEARFPSVQAFFEALVEAASRPAAETALAHDLVRGLDEPDDLPPLAGEATTVNAIVPSAPSPDERASFTDEEPRGLDAEEGFNANRTVLLNPTAQIAKPTARSMPVARPEEPREITSLVEDVVPMRRFGAIFWIALVLAVTSALAAIAWVMRARH